MYKKLISVIVPIYNVEPYLRKCIDSIINQTYSNLEIILVNDGSTDNCGIICDEYKKIDNRITVIHKTNGGLSSARNTGLDIAHGNFISFVDSDDYLELNMLEELSNNMEKHCSDISICNINYIKNGKNRILCNNSSKKEFVSKNKEKFVNIQNDYDSLTVYAWNKLYKKETFNNIRYPEGKIYEDSFILCDLLENANSISYTTKPLYNHIYRSDSIVNKFTINHFDKIGSFNKKIDFLNDKGYYDLAYEEKKRKMNILIINLSKMKRYHIKNKEVYKKYYKELLDTNKEVKWNNATWKNKLFKVLRRPSISILAFGLRVRDLIRR